MHTPCFPTFRSRLAALGRRTVHLIRQATLAQLEEHLRDFLPAPLLSAEEQGPNSRDRIFSLRLTFECFLWQLLKPKTSCREVVRQVQALFRLRGRGHVDEGDSAYIQARLRLPKERLEKALTVTAQAADRRAGPGGQLNGRPVKAVDASTTQLADTRQNQQRYPQPAAQKAGCGFPVMRLVALFSLASGAIVNVILGSLHQHDLRLLRGLWDQLKHGDILLGDRAYGEYTTLATGPQQGVDVVARLHARRKVDFRKARRLAKNDGLFVWTKGYQQSEIPSATEWGLLPAQITVRIIRFTATIRGFRARRITLVTTLLDPKNYPAQALIALYARRWRLELCLRDLKTTMGMEQLRCKSPDMAEKELLAYLVAHNLIRCLIAEAVARYQVDLERVSFKGSVDALRQYSDAIAKAPNRTMRRQLWEDLLLNLARDLVRYRPNRQEPRAVKRRPKPYPLLNQPRRCFVEISHRIRYWKGRPAIIEALTKGHSRRSSLLSLKALRRAILSCCIDPRNAVYARPRKVNTNPNTTMKTRYLSFGLALGLCVPALAQLSPGNPLVGLEKLKEFEAMRASSSDPDWRNGNADARPIEPGGTLVLADLQGPGMIVHFWNTIAHSAPFYSRLITLRIYWDGEKNPSVECPIGDFFGVGHGLDKPFVSLPIKVSSDGRGRNCYWPMPFRKSARVTVTNESDKRCDAFYYYLDWQKHESLPKDTAYFHAMYRQEYPCVMGRNYLLADLEGRGHYVGTVQSVQNMSAGWYGEGDDFFFIDGEAEPSLRGTGTEDYFCDGWGFRQHDGPFYGVPLWEGYEAGKRGSVYRFHIPDPVPFKKSLRVEIEHKGSQDFPDKTSSGFIERDDLMSSVAFWYQIEPHKPWPALPPGPERLAERTLPLVFAWREVPTAKHSDHPIQVQDLPGVAEQGKQLFFTPQDDKGWVELTFKVDKDLNAHLVGNLIRSFDYGIYRVTLDGEELGVVNLYSQDVKRQAENWGAHKLSAGPHVLRLECKGKSDKSKGYFLGVDSFAAAVPVYERPPGFDLRKIQK